MRVIVPVVLALSFLSLLVTPPARGSTLLLEESFPTISVSGPGGGGPPGDPGGSTSAHFTCTTSEGAAFFSASFTCIPVGASDAYMFNWTVNGEFVSNEPVLNYTVTNAGAGQASYVVRLQTFSHTAAPSPTLVDDFSFTVTINFSYNLMLYVPALVIGGAGTAAYVMARLRRHRR